MKKALIMFILVTCFQAVVIKTNAEQPDTPNNNTKNPSSEVNNVNSSIIDQETQDLLNRGYSQHMVDTYKIMKHRAHNQPVSKPNKLKTTVGNIISGDWTNTTEEFGTFEVKKN